MRLTGVLHQENVFQVDGLDTEYVLVLGIREALSLHFSSGPLEGDVETRWYATVGIGDHTYLMTTSASQHTPVPFLRYKIPIELTSIEIL